MYVEVHTTNEVDVHTPCTFRFKEMVSNEEKMLFRIHQWIPYARINFFKVFAKFTLRNDFIQSHKFLITFDLLL